MPRAKARTPRGLRTGRGSPPGAAARHRPSRPLRASRGFPAGHDPGRHHLRTPAPKGRPGPGLDGVVLVRPRRGRPLGHEQRTSEHEEGGCDASLGPSRLCALRRLGVAYRVCGHASTSLGVSGRVDSVRQQGTPITETATVPRCWRGAYIARSAGPVWRRRRAGHSCRVHDPVMAIRGGLLGAVTAVRARSESVSIVQAGQPRAGCVPSHLGGARSSRLQPRGR